MGSQNTKYTGHNFNNNKPSDSKNALLGVSGFGKGAQFGRSGSVQYSEKSLSKVSYSYQFLSEMGKPIKKNKNI